MNYCDNCGKESKMVTVFINGKAYCRDCYEKYYNDKNENKVDHPFYYIAKTGLEVFEVIEAFDLGYHLGNVVKYILRAGKKSKETEIEDLKKAICFIERRIKILEDDN